MLDLRPLEKIPNQVIKHFEKKVEKLIDGIICLKLEIWQNPLKVKTIKTLSEQVKQGWYL